MKTREEDREEKREDKKREEARQEKRQDEREREREMEEKISFLKNVSRPSNPPDELAKNASKKSFSDELFLHFFFESSESDRVFNHLLDSNSISRAG